ncbi:MAG: LysM peptidoglycan-binding domain-containing M23 family metallopeptidase [Alphaproteobacteria bacterium]|nr:LysM peptidoglycan-binding domain-containing M23 family metallopeptidase [Alphaproteobacteria bacterium]
MRIFLLCTVVISGCDLQPKISSIPDNIGIFIEDRYPALLADPEKQPEIYNSAVTDYGVYASPELYGSAKTDDYVLYASVDDYVLIPENPETQPVKSDEKIEQEIQEDYLIVPVYGGNTIIDEKSEIKPTTKQDEIIVVKGDTVYSLARKNNMSVKDFAKINSLKEPYTLSVGQRLSTKKTESKPEIPNLISQEKVQQIKSEKAVVKESVTPNNVKKVDLQEITIVPGDTLYSLSRKYEIPVNDLAVMNKLSAPFNLSVGQKIKVPKMDNVKTVSVNEVKTVVSKKTDNVKSVKQNVSTTKQPNTKSVVVPDNKQQKISSDPRKQLPKISARSASKFSWPVRGKILSQYGAKNNGLFNDGINISASRGTVVKAAENGVVAYAGNEVKGMGNLVIMQHADGWMTVYAHMDSMSVKRGTKVSVGQQIGKIGMTGKVDKPQLHFEIRKGTKAYNPTQYLKK